MAPAMDMRRGGLPVQVTGFVGRTAELAMVARLLGEARLVTLVGPGGVGKTRIALQSAGAVRDRFADGVCLVELSALSDPALLAHTVAGTLGLPEQDSRPALEHLVECLAGRQVLLVLDTCEHLVEACAMLAELLLREAPAVTILATTRQPLDVAGEHTLLISPLPVSELGAGDDAVALFAQRAAAVVPGFTVGEANHASVAALCRRLDGIPLAIELATVRLRAIPLEGLLNRLEDRFSLLTARRSSLPRHQTLRTTITWSHDLCDPDERLLWARLSVFSGPFDLAAVEAVCSDGKLPADRIVEHLVGLVDKSVLLRQEGRQDRYRLLDTLREFGTEQLEALGQDEQVRRRHLEYYREMARAFNARAFSGEQLSLFQALDQERPNLRSALEHALAVPGEERRALAFAVSLWPYWLCGARLAEGRHWLERALSLVPEAVPERAEGLGHLGFFALQQGAQHVALPWIEESLEIANELDDEGLRAHAIQHLAVHRLLSGRADEGFPLFDDACARLTALGDRQGLAIALMEKGALHALSGDGVTAIQVTGQALELVGEGSGECWLQGYVLFLRGLARWTLGDLAGSVREARLAVRMKYALGDHLAVADCLELLAWQAADQERMVRACWLLGAAERVWRQFAAPLAGAPLLLRHHDRAIEEVSKSLGPERYAAIFRQGGSIPLGDAVHLAEQDIDAIPVQAPRRAAMELLSPREREVAGLVEEGLTNREIAERLVISKRTADAHIEHILAKLGVSSRVEIAELVASGSA
ncbi:LuxR C-terminal-related transcriptional regulator [Nonomuraea sp. NBC_01738]|uniref:ATP-binding protein n=1 Tax=Nonomuraea sp. NBC_01738 TaxID=2976003 RepID=UPI002E0E3C5F|nr:LuxR C-terminal-related transcriptional regulator [Nonomuraea sp. NBC_01738]